MSYYDRMTVPVHDVQEFHKYVNHDTGRQTLIAERTTDYDTHGDLPLHILIHNEGTFTMYSAPSKGVDLFYNTSDRRDDTEVRLLPEYRPGNTAIRIFDTEVDLVEETSIGWVRVIASRDEQRNLHLKAADISERYAELLLSTHENFGSRIDGNEWHAIKQLTNPIWAFKVFSEGNRYE
jgi:hypothetical protein